MKRSLSTKMLAFLLGMAVFTVGCNKYDDDINSLNDRVTTLETEVASIPDQLEAIKKTIPTLDELEKQVSDLETAMDKANDDLATANTNISTLTGKVAANEGVIASQGTTITELSGKIDANIASIGTLTTDLATANSEIDALQTSLADYATKAELATTEQTLQAAIDLKESIANVDAIESKLEGLINTVSGDLATLTTTVGQIQTIAGENSAAIGALMSDLGALERELGNLETSLENYYTKSQIDEKFTAVEARVLAIETESAEWLNNAEVKALIDEYVTLAYMETLGAISETDAKALVAANKALIDGLTEALEIDENGESTIRIDLDNLINQYRFKIAEIEGRLDSVEDALATRITGIVNVPTGLVNNSLDAQAIFFGAPYYHDATGKMQFIENDGGNTTTVKFRVSPASIVETITEEMISVYTEKVGVIGETKANPYDFTVVPGTLVKDVANGTITFDLNTMHQFGAELIAGDAYESLLFSVDVAHGGAVASSEYLTVVYLPGNDLEYMLGLDEASDDLYSVPLFDGSFIRYTSLANNDEVGVLMQNFDVIARYSLPNPRVPLAFSVPLAEVCNGAITAEVKVVVGEEDYIYSPMPEVVEDEINTAKYNFDSIAVAANQRPEVGSFVNTPSYYIEFSYKGAVILKSDKFFTHVQIVKPQGEDIATTNIEEVWSYDEAMIANPSSSKGLGLYVHTDLAVEAGKIPAAQYADMLAAGAPTSVMIFDETINDYVTAPTSLYQITLYPNQTFDFAINAQLVETEELNIKFVYESPLYRDAVINVVVDVTGAPVMTYAHYLTEEFVGSYTFKVLETSEMFFNRMANMSVDFYGMTVAQAVDAFTATPAIAPVSEFDADGKKLFTMNKQAANKNVFLTFNKAIPLAELANGVSSTTDNELEIVHESGARLVVSIDMLTVTNPFLGGLVDNDLLVVNDTVIVRTTITPNGGSRYIFNAAEEMDNAIYIDPVLLASNDLERRFIITEDLTAFTGVPPVVVDELTGLVDWAEWNELSLDMRAQLVLVVDRGLATETEYIVDTRDFEAVIFDPLAEEITVETIPALVPGEIFDLREYLELMYEYRTTPTSPFTTGDYFITNPLVTPSVDVEEAIHTSLGVTNSSNVVLSFEIDPAKNNPNLVRLIDNSHKPNGREISIISPLTEDIQVDTELTVTLTLTYRFGTRTVDIVIPVPATV